MRNSAPRGLSNMAIGSQPALTPERRRKDRSIRIFRPACIEAEGKAYLATMKDISEYGCGFEGAIPLTPGQPVRYRWSSRAFVTATVVWVDGMRFGLMNDAPCDIGANAGFPYRSVRIPFEHSASVFVCGRRIDAAALNIAQKGLCIALDEPIPAGCLCTIEVCGAIFPNATIRWLKGDSAGFALEKPMSLRALAFLTNPE